MSRLHSTLVALVLAAAAAAGLFAAVHTVRLGQTVAAPKTTSGAARAIASRKAKLARWGHGLREARAKRPPALPKLPKFAPVRIPQAPPAPAPAAPVAAAAPQVRYVRPRPVVKYRHASRTAPTTTTTTPQPSWSEDGETDGGGASDDGSTGGGD